VWKDTKNVLVTKGYVPPIHDFNIVDQAATNFTQEFMSAKGYSFILVSYDLKKINRDVLPKVNEFAEACEKAGIKFYGLTSNGAEETDIFRHDVNAMYPFYFCDMTQLKTIIRSNPGLVMIKDGVVTGMWHYHTFPKFDAVKAQYGF
jgi:triosephosphate isomerase